MLNNFNSQLLDKSKLYVLAISGGPDSMFLLDNMYKKGYRLVVTHVNYKKRDDSDYDEKLVKDYCTHYSLSCEVYIVKNSDYFDKANFQDNARQIRYNFFQLIAQKYYTKYIVLAHHYDDHLETYLLQKHRQSLVDYWGLPTRTKNNGYWIIRPLLAFTKDYIYHYLQTKRIDYATDITNSLPIYQRNIIRQQIINYPPEKKQQLAGEINYHNQHLNKIKALVKAEKQRLIKLNNSLELDQQASIREEIYLRLIYKWISQTIPILLLKRKKKILKEVYKQLFRSQKRKLIIELGSNWQIKKSFPYAFICFKN